MRSLLFSSTLLIAAFLCPQVAHTQTTGTKPPRPLPLLEDDRETVTNADFDRLLHVLREERSALDAEWQAMSKRSKLGKSTISDKALRDMADALRFKLQPELLVGPNKKSADPEGPLHPDTIKDPIKKPTQEETTSKPDDKKNPISADPLKLGQTFFRAGMYTDALATLEKVEIIGMKPEERAPILYFKACCQAQLGQSAKAIALFEDVVKVRGDERLVDYARWQLEELVWHRNVENTLQDIRRRLKAAENAK